MTALADGIEILTSWYSSLVEEFFPEEVRTWVVGKALESLEVPGDALLIPADKETLFRLLLDVFVWRRMEQETALLFDFSADGASFSKSQLSGQATRMRLRAENSARAAGLLAEEGPSVEISGWPGSSTLFWDEWENRTCGP